MAKGVFAMFTVDDARKVLSMYRKNGSRSREITKFSLTTNFFVIIFLVISCVRSFFVATFIVALFNQQPDISLALTKGYGFIGLIAYIVLSAIDLMGILDLGLVITVIICSFVLGGGITANFLPYLLPVFLLYAGAFTIIFILNCLFNLIVKKISQDIYDELKHYVAWTNYMKGI